MILRTIFYLFILSAFTQCNSSKSTAEVDKIDNLEGIYYITQLAELEVLDHNLTINFDSIELTISGYAGCNRYFGAYTQDNETLTMNNIAATKMYCQSEVQRKLEDQLLKSLPRIDSIGKMESGVYILYAETKSIIQISNIK